MQLHWLWFALLPGLKTRQKLALLEHFSDPEEIFHATASAFSHMDDMTQQAYEALQNKDLTRPTQLLKHCREIDVGILPFGSKEYPARLRNIDDPPLVLYYKGLLPDFSAQPSIAVVGTRKATGYGMNCAKHISHQIAACGGLIVSGAASGIDTAAMEGALAAGKPVVGVLGCGVDVVYPKSNQHLFKKILENGCLLSEYPPGTQAMAWHFPARNRIVSGITNGVVVIEAPERSGALITASRAFEQGRDVFAVPGNIDMQTCRGSNALLQEYASAVFCGWDVMKQYQSLYPEKVKKQDMPLEEKPAETAEQVAEKEPVSRDADKKSIDNAPCSPYSGIETLSEEERAVIAHITQIPEAVDAVIQRSGIPAAKVLRILTMLALKGVVIHHPGKRVSLKK